MFTVEEVAEQLGVSKVTIYAKLKKFDDRVVMKQGKKYITEDLLSLIKQDLKIKDIGNLRLNNNIDIDEENKEIATDREDLINLNKDLIKTLMQQLEVKDKQLEEKDKQILELLSRIEQMSKLVENGQVLLKEKEVQNPLLIQERIESFDMKLEEIRERMEQRKEDKKGFWNRFKK